MGASQIPDQLAEELSRPGRKLLIAEAEICFDSGPRNVAYVIEVEERSGAAGGRAAGIGLRKPTAIMGYTFDGEHWTLLNKVTHEQEISKYELPYHATAMDVTLPNGSTVVVSGVIDPGLVSTYQALTRG
jgi:hypothetical protein